MVVFDYFKWGLAAGTDRDAKKISNVSKDQHEAAMKILCACSEISLERFCLISEGLVRHYCAPNRDPAYLVWLRFERCDGRDAGIMGEHLSVLIDLNNNRIVGLTRMDRNLNGHSCLSHQAAVTVAINFLKRVAPDLVPRDVVPPNISNSCLDGCKIYFEEHPIRFGNVELHRMGDHVEELEIDGQTIEVHGIKVKMYIPSTGLWAWVVVDKTGAVETFERDIFWNFGECRRETQMWLHDKWLKVHAIKPRVLDF